MLQSRRAAILVTTAIGLATVMHHNALGQSSGTTLQVPGITQPFVPSTQSVDQGLRDTAPSPTLDPYAGEPIEFRAGPPSEQSALPTTTKGDLSHAAEAGAQPVALTPSQNPANSWSFGSLVSPEKFRGSASTFAFIGMVSLAPAVLLMTTSFVRLSIVFTLLRQAIGAQILPSNQILTTLAMFLTVCIMWPTWMKVYDEAIVPYTNASSSLTAEQAWKQGVMPVRNFMSEQIELAGNSENIVMFYNTLPDMEEVPEAYDDVPLRILLPAYLLSELKVAFLLGFQIYLPFLVIDIFVSAVTTSMGMLMLPPLSVALPLKLIVFVMVDGWNLLAGTVITSFMVPG